MPVSTLGCAASLNDILITQFKSVFASTLVQSAFYGGYFLISISASLVIRSSSYKLAIILGLALDIIGCALFYSAARMATYTMFQAAIFAISIGLSFLEPAANTYSAMIGHRDYVTLRLNISQTFYSVGALMGIVLGKYPVFDEGGSLESRMASMTAQQIHAFRLTMLGNTLEPYKYLIMVLLGVLLLFMLTRFPHCKPQPVQRHAAPGMAETLRLSGGQPSVPPRGSGTIFVCGFAGGGMVVHYSSGADARGRIMSATRPIS